MRDQVLQYLTTIPKGKVVTYGQIADALGHPGAARAVGNILHNNQDGDKFPCYKVVDSRGKLSCHYAFGGLSAQAQKLLDDGIEVNNNRVELKKYQVDLNRK